MAAVFVPDLQLDQLDLTNDAVYDSLQEDLKHVRYVNTCAERRRCTTVTHTLQQLRQEVTDAEVALQQLRQTVTDKETALKDAKVALQQKLELVEEKLAPLIHTVEQKKRQTIPLSTLRHTDNHVRLDTPPDTPLDTPLEPPHKQRQPDTPPDSPLQPPPKRRRLDTPPDPVPDSPQDPPSTTPESFDDCFSPLLPYADRKKFEDMLLEIRASNTNIDWILERDGSRLRPWRGRARMLNSIIYVCPVCYRHMIQTVEDVTIPDNQLNMLYRKYDIMSIFDNYAQQYELTDVTHALFCDVQEWKKHMIDHHNVEAQHQTVWKLKDMVNAWYAGVTNGSYYYVDHHAEVFVYNVLVKAVERRTERPPCICSDVIDDLPEVDIRDFVVGDDEVEWETDSDSDKNDGNRPRRPPNPILIPLHDDSAL